MVSGSQLGDSGMILRIAAFVFWVFTYFLFLVTVVYFAGFLTNRYMPGTIDSGLQIPAGEAAVRDIFLLALFGLQHSVMAREWWKRLWPAPLERSVYLLATSVVLMAIYRYWEPIPNLVWKLEAVAPVLNALQIAGLGLILWASVITGHWDKFGFRQVWAYLARRPYRPTPFRITGPYRYSRHPMMLGLILILWAAPEASQGRLLFAGVLTIYIFIGIHFEEKDMARYFGVEYDEYRRRVRLIV
jgi:protein-S-isoprenylcysteine O-methyltransferase Ste14